jgi:LAO/AO transport system kinase
VQPDSSRISKGSASPARRRGRLAPEAYIEGVLQGDRATLARAITIVESDLESDGELAAEILQGILAEAGDSLRVGITGVPGAGKSTFIDVLGMHIVRDRAEKVAVLSVDPSSPVSGGSILGDKTRMERLSVEERAFIRPSPARGHLGGVARRTRETILLCEAAGYRNILVETVGVGQSETAVRSMTDFFLLLMLAGAGDELQGIKRGILEMLDAMAINKADGDNRLEADRARVQYAGALHLFPASPDGWTPRVLTCSALANEGIREIWEMVLQHHEKMRASGWFLRRRRQQALAWMRELVLAGLEEEFFRNPAVRDRMPALEEAVRTAQATSFTAARELLALFRNRPGRARTMPRPDDAAPAHSTSRPPGPDRGFQIKE